MDPLGQVLHDTYRLESVLGEGGMGTVYKASHLRLDRFFAVKLLIKAAATDDAALARFQREARVTSALGHPHIVEVLDFNFTPDGAPFLVMEFLQGENLEQRIDRFGALPLHEVASIMRQVTSALHVAHEKGVIHRDLKPQNIFLCQRGSQDDYIKLLDFGISKVLGSKSVMTQTKALVGSPSYMSPEQAEELAKDVDVRSDVYSMGTILFEMLTGQTPFQAASIPSLLYKVVHKDPPSLSTIRPELSDGLDGVVLKALSKRPADRYQTIEAFWLDLSRVMEEEAVNYQEVTKIIHTAWPEAPGAALQSSVTANIDRSPRPGEVTDRLLRHKEARPRVGGSTTLSTSVGEVGRPARRIKPFLLVAVIVWGLVLGGFGVYVLLGSSASRRTTIITGAGGTGTAAAVARQDSSPSTPGDRGAGRTASSPPAPDARVARRPDLGSPPLDARGPDTAVHADLRLAPASPRPKRKTRVTPRVKKTRVVISARNADGSSNWAKVFINGKYVGDTPKIIKLAPNRYRVKVERGGFRNTRVVRIKKTEVQHIRFSID